MFHWFNDISIKIKIYAAFALILLILSIVTATPLLSISSMNNNVATVTTEIQPAAISSVQFDKTINEASTYLGYYMLTQEAAFKEKYTNSINKAEKILFDLNEHFSTSNNEASLNLVTAIKSNMDQLKQHNQHLIKLALNPNENIPALSYAAQKINPVSQKILQTLYEIVLSNQEEDASTIRKRIFSEVSEFRYQWSNVMTQIRSYLAFRAESTAKEIISFYDSTGVILERLLKYKENFNFEEEEGIEQIQELRTNFKPLLSELIKIHGSEEWRGDSHHIKQNVAPLINVMKKNIDQLIGIQENNASVMSNEVHSQSTIITNTMILLMVSSLIIGIIIALALTRSVIFPLNNIKIAMMNIAEGEGDLTQRLDDRGKNEISSLAKAFNTFIKKIQATVELTANASKTIASSTEDVSAITNQTSTDMQHQKREIDDVANSINQMANTTHEISNNTKQTATSAIEAKSSAEDGTKVIDTAVKSMNLLNQEFQNVSSVILSVEEQSNEIGNVLNVIRDISEQTNLLALNAAIEAARAGETGRGFAVVADEVRSLSHRTNESTNEIQKIIERLQHDTKQTVNAVGNANTQASKSIESVENASKAFKSIALAVNTINDMTKLIASSTDEQSISAVDINEKIASIKHAVEKTADAALDTAAKTNDFSLLTDELLETVTQFKI